MLRLVLENPSAGVDLLSPFDGQRCGRRVNGGEIGQWVL